jgi:hypothetical protein
MRHSQPSATELQHCPIGQHHIPLTFFDDAFARVQYQDNLTLPELAEEIRGFSEPHKSKLPWLKMAIFGENASRNHCLRTNANVKEVTGVEIDHDSGRMPFDEAVQRLKNAGLRSLVYTSASYVKDEKEKWRVLAPLSASTAPAARAELVAVLNGVLCGFAAPESFVLSTAFFYGSVNHNPDHRVEVIDGDFLDLRPDLVAGQIGKNGKKTTNGAGNGTAHPSRDEAEILGLLAKSKRRGKWHNAMLSAVASMVGKGWGDAAIHDACAPYLRNEHGRAELDRLIAGGREKWGVADPDRDVIGAAAPVVAAAIAATGGVITVPGPNWLERYVLTGRPRPSLYNARLAIEDSGIRCAEDVFHNQMTIACEGAKLPFVGEVTDGSLQTLRGYLLDKYRFDLGERHVRDAVVILARENRFNPVTDMLEAAEADWDGIGRLDRMASDYFNCDDTELNRQCVRKTMLAAVARARRPGCKWDTILVLESPEGWNKSSVWAVLAGDGNFSDASILGHSGREVQEQLAGIWIHENPELAGMKKADVETIKAFASRQVDRARPAYGRFLIEQKRHSIEVGTTNSGSYLQSPTGNRRFWPMRVNTVIDLAKLQRDRLQLWGEAAHYQSQGEGLILDEALWPLAGVEQELRRVRHPWENLLASMVPAMGELLMGNAILTRVGDEERVHTRIIFSELLEISGGQLHRGHAISLAEIMKIQGWTNKETRINGVLGSGYVRKKG